MQTSAVVSDEDGMKINVSQNIVLMGTTWVYVSTPW